MFRRLSARVLATIAAIATLSIASSALAGAAYADHYDTAVLSISKTVDGQSSVTRAPGQAIVYNIAVACSTQDCVDARVVDELPAAFDDFEIESVTVIGTNSAGETVSSSVDQVDRTITVSFTDPLEIGEGTEVGLESGVAPSILVTLRIPADLSPDWPENGIAVPNTAEALAHNAATVESTAEVTVSVPVSAGTTVTKSWAPSSTQYKVGETTTVTLGIANDSNVAATSLRIDEPQSPASSTPFEYLDLVSFGAMTLPEGADRVTVDARVPDGAGGFEWANGSPSISPQLPGGVDPADVTALRILFDSSAGRVLAADGAAGSLQVVVAQRSTARSGGESLLLGYSAPNTVLGTVVAGRDDLERTDTASAALTVAGLNSVVSASKSFLTDPIPAGTSTIARIIASNASNGPLQTMTITEPSAGETFFTESVVFGGFDNDSAAQFWPGGAESAELTYNFSTGSPQVIGSIAAGSPLPDPTVPLGAHVTGFVLHFEGDADGIAVSANSNLRFHVQVADDLVGSGSATLTNSITVVGFNDAGESDPSTATDTLQVYFPQIDLSLDKTVTPDASKPVPPGGQSTVRLEASTASGSAWVRPTEIVIVDRADDAGSDYWDAFDATWIGSTQVQLGATLRIDYHEVGAADETWVEHVTVDATVAAQLHSGSLPSGVDIDGLRFTFVKADGFAQGTSVSTAIAFTARDVLRGTTDPTFGVSPITYLNTSTSTTEGAVGFDEPQTLVTATATDSASGAIKDIDEGDLGDAAIASKEWLGDPTLPSQSGQTRTARLQWGTEVTGIDSVTVSDPADHTAPVGSTVFATHDLVSIGAITASTDPLFRYDQLIDVTLWYDGQWNSVSSCSDATPCRTSWSGYTLTTSERALTTAVRLVFEENDVVSNNPRTTNAGAPPVGSGVASSPDGRRIDLVFALRNSVRGSEPVEWITEDSTFNTASAGEIENDMRVTLVRGGETGGASDSDTQTLVDVAPAVSMSKSSSASALTIPHPDDVAPADYPAVTFTTVSKNASFARAWSIRTSDPMPCAPAALLDCVEGNPVDDPYAGLAYDPETNPFENLTITDISYSLQSGSGVSVADSTATLWHYTPADGVAPAVVSTSTVSLATANSMTAGQLEDVVGVSVLWASTGTDGGTIVSGRDLTLRLETQLRVTERSDASSLVTAETVANWSVAQTFDGVIEYSGSGYYGADDATVELRSGVVDVTAAKSLSSSSLLERDRDDVITVTLGAGSGASTVSTNEVAIVDESSEFWNALELDSIQSITRPYGTGFYRLDAKTAAGWQLGELVTSGTALPAGVEHPEVLGLRVVFQRSLDGDTVFSDRAVPQAWSAGLVFRVVVRDAYAAEGSPIVWPSTVDNTAQSSSTHHAYGTETAERARTLSLATGTFRVDLSKTRQLATSPAGQTFDWTITATNTGTGFLDEPVIVDRLPVDGSLPAGAALLYDPTAPLSFAGSSGGILPVEDAIVDYDDTSRTVTVSWPEGSRLAPGEQVQVVLPLQIAPALPSNYDSPGFPATSSYDGAVNVAEFSSIETLEACTNSRPGTGSGRGVDFTAGSTLCRTDNNVTVQSASGLATFKGVKGDVEDVNATVDGAANVLRPDADCIANTDGFYRYPCAANTVIGGTDEWTLRTVNGGNIPATELTVVDVLPHTGDELLGTGAARESQYSPVFAGAVTVDFDALSQDISYDWELTTDADPCPAFTTDGTCSSGTTWVDGASFPVEDYDQVRGIRVTFDFSATDWSVANPGTWQPGGVITVGYDTVNRPTTTLGDDRVSVTAPVSNERAWNTFGAFASFGGDETDRRVEPQKAGVQIAAGPLQIDKAIDGDYADRNPNTSYTMQVECVVDGVPVALGDGGEVVVTESGTPSYSTVVAGLPLGSECEVVEVGGGASSVSYTTTSGSSATSGVVTIAEASEAATPLAQVVTVTNTYDPGQLQITKEASVAITEGGETYDYTITVGNTGAALATGVTVTDELPDSLRFVSAAGEGWSGCSVDGDDIDGFGGDLACSLDDDLPVGETAPLLTITVDVLETVSVDEIVNRAIAASTNPTVDGDVDDEETPVRWLDVTAAPQCVLDAPWLTYEVSARNVDLTDETLEVTWATADGTVRHVDEISPTPEEIASGTMSGRILWPGAAVDADERGTAWPGWRPAAPGETPDWENLVFDPDAFGADLRDDARITLSINPEWTITGVDYPPATEACAEASDSEGRTPEMGLSKTVRSETAEGGDEVVYEIVGWNEGLGAIDLVSIVDDLPAQLAFESITWEDPEGDAPTWDSCTPSGADREGFGGEIRCELDRPLGFGESTPTLVLTTTLHPDVLPGWTRNVVSMTGVDIDFPELATLSLESTADVMTPLPALADTGNTAGALFGHALLALLLGLGLAGIARTRVQRAAA